MIKYFIAFEVFKDGKTGKGNGEVFTKVEITGIEDIKEIQGKYAEENGFSNMVITNFIRLK